MYADLVRALPSCGVECRGLVAGSDRAATESGGAVRAFAPVDVSVLQRWKGMRAAARDELQTNKPDIVVSHFAFYAFPVVRMIQQAGVPFAVHFQGPWAGESKAEGAGRVSVGMKAALERTVYTRARRLIVLSDAFGEILARDYGISAEIIRTVPPGIETARFQPDIDRRGARAKLGWPTDRPIVLSVRRLVQRMGLENLIDSVAAIKQSVPDVLVLIAGKGPLTTVLTERINNLGLTDHVRLLGFVPDDDLPLAYTAADVSIVPTVALEGFGLIVVESLSAGTPVFVTPVGGLPEAVRELSKDLIMRDCEPTTIAEVLSSALRGNLPIPSAAACRTFAEDSYDWRVIAPRIREVYEEAIAAP